MINQKVAQEVFQKLLTIPENRYCFECGVPNAQWTSVSHGIFICLNCCSIHRQLGTHISQVKSIQLDSWNDSALNMMTAGGNHKFKCFLEANSIFQEIDINKYRTKGVQYYRLLLKSIVDQTQPPIPPLSDEMNMLVQEAQSTQGLSVQSQNEENTNSLQKVKGALSIAYVKTSEATKSIINRVDGKISDPQFKEELRQLGSDISTKSKEVGTKTVEYAKIGATGIKTGVENMWGFLKQKLDNRNNIKSLQQQ